jgi:hypothetical protein
MSERSKGPFDVVREGCARFVPSLDTLLARWAEGCDQSFHTNAGHILKASGYTFRSIDGRHFAEGFACPHCAAERVADRSKEATPSCFLVGGNYQPNGGTPRSLQCRACRGVTRPSALPEYLHPTKPKRRAFLEAHCGGAKPQERRWVAARLDGKVATASEAETAIDKVSPDTFSPQVELCLLLAIETPNLAELELPYLTVELSERGEVKALGWHGERPTVNEEARHADWLRRARRQRQREIERRTQLVRAELERETPL